MEGYILLLCKYKECSCALRFQKDRSFSDLRSDLKDNFGFVDVDSVFCHYSIPEHPKCLLRNDTDLNTMCQIADAFGMKCVSLTIEVEVASYITPINALSMSEDNGGHTLSLCGVGDDGVDNGGLMEENSVSSSTSSSHDISLLSNGWSNQITHVGQVFEKGMSQFRDALCKFSIEQGFKFKYVKNTSLKVHAVCALKDKNECKWSIHALCSKVDGHCFVRKYVREHKCGVTTYDLGCKRLTFNKMGELIVNKVQADTEMKPKDVVNQFRVDFGLRIPYKKAWRALEEAKTLFYGEAADSFKRLQTYVSDITSTNPGSHVVLDVDEHSRRFRRIFFAFAACINGFKWCRPLLFLDGTFLKGKFKGVLLSAIGKDGNQGFFLLAFAVVDSETQDNWGWFLTEVRKIIGEERVLNFVSDRNAGLLEALPAVFPRSSHFFCLKHLKNNLKDQLTGRMYNHEFRDKLLKLLGECAHAPSESLLREKLTELKKSGGSIVERFLDGIPLHNWTNAYGGGCRYGEMTSIAVESFNSWILDIRDLNVTPLIDTLCVKLMKMFTARRDLSQQWNGVLCPKMLNHVNTSMKECRTYVVHKSSESIYEVVSPSSFTVDISRRTCSCFAWQLNGFPCTHAYAAICDSSFQIHEVVEPFFHVDNYRKSYEGIIYPIPTVDWSIHEMSDEEEILPPLVKRQPGRPRKQRFKSRSEREITRSIRCGRCRKVGHNKKTCKEPLA